MGMRREFWAEVDLLKAALRYRGVDPDGMSAERLANELARRLSDRDARRIMGTISRALATGWCQMTHCPEHGGAFALHGCLAGKTPGRCGKARAFVKRREEREAGQESGESRELQAECDALLKVVWQFEGLVRDTALAQARAGRRGWNRPSMRAEMAGMLRRAVERLISGDAKQAEDVALLACFLRRLPLQED